MNNFNIFYSMPSKNKSGTITLNFLFPVSFYWVLSSFSCLFMILWHTPWQMFKETLLQTLVQESHFITSSRCFYWKLTFSFLSLGSSSTCFSFSVFLTTLNFLSTFTASTTLTRNRCPSGVSSPLSTLITKKQTFIGPLLKYTIYVLVC
jgi:hypothetical protein